MTQLTLTQMVYSWKTEVFWSKTHIKYGSEIKETNEVSVKTLDSAAHAHSFMGEFNMLISELVFAFLLHAVLAGEFYHYG